MAKKRRVNSSSRGSASSGGPRRSMIAIVLVGFVLVASGVIARRVVGVQQQTEIQKLRSKQAALVADRVRVEAAIREASSRARLQPIAEQRLNMHIPLAEQQVLLPRRPASTSPSDSR